MGFSTPSSGAGQTLALHWNGTSWKVINSPNVGTLSNVLAAVAVVSATDIWAVGASGGINNARQTLTEHWNGTSWQVVKSLDIGTTSNVLVGVAAITATNVWAVGIQFTSVDAFSMVPLIEQYCC